MSCPSAAPKWKRRLIGEAGRKPGHPLLADRTLIRRRAEKTAFPRLTPGGGAGPQLVPPEHIAPSASAPASPTRHPGQPSGILPRPTNRLAGGEHRHRAGLRRDILGKTRCIKVFIHADMAIDRPWWRGHGTSDSMEPIIQTGASADHGWHAQPAPGEMRRYDLTSTPPSPASWRRGDRSAGAPAPRSWTRPSPEPEGFPCDAARFSPTDLRAMEDVQRVRAVAPRQRLFLV